MANGPLLFNVEVPSLPLANVTLLGCPTDERYSRLSGARGHGPFDPQICKPPRPSPFDSTKPTRDCQHAPTAMPTVASRNTPSDST